MFRWIRNKRDLSTKEREENFSINGAAVLEQIIRSFNGDCNPIRSYSAEELRSATNDFQLDTMYSGSNCIMCQGIYQNCKIVVKKFKRPKNETNQQISNILELAANDIAIASRMSNHKNVLKPLGCCLETGFPISVYEFPENGNLATRLFNQQSDRLSWDQKLKIVIEIANSVAYLHYGLPNTFVHRNIKPSNIFLDRNLSPKLSDFKLALRIPKGETFIEETISGTLVYLAPETFSTGYFTVKSDVYSFGVLLYEVITEIRINDLYELYHETPHSDTSTRIKYDCIVRDRAEEHCKHYLEDQNIGLQAMEYVKIMQRCLKSNPDDRPDMIEAEKALRRIKTL